MFHKIIPVLVDNIVQNGHIDLKISKIIPYFEIVWQILMTYYLVIKKTNNFCINQKVNFGADLGAFFLSKRNSCLFQSLMALK